VVSLIIGTTAASTSTYSDTTVVERQPVRERVIERDRT
jgi:hypothetical protein